ncbi:MAG: APC family permease [Neomegalonema sp.]|nr:APC family permease [Neomegalonema sp.]
MSQNNGKPALKRRIGFWLLTLYGVGVMVGAGIYVLVGEVAQEAGRATPWAFLLAGLAAAFTALSFSELAVRAPESAGEAAYAKAAFGSTSFALIIGGTVALLGLLTGAAVLRGGAGYLSALIDLPKPALIIGLGLLLCGAAIVGVLESLALAALFTIAELAGLLLIISAGLLSDPAPVSVSESWSMSGLSAAIFLAFFAFIGFEDMVNMAEETKDPGRTMPRAIITALILVCALYALVSYAAVRTVGAAALAASDAPLALVWERASGASAAHFSIIAVLAAANGVLAQMVMAARIGFGLGRQTRLLRFLHETHPRFGTPVRATLLAAALAIALALAAPVDALAKTATFAILAVFAVMNLALIVLKRRHPAPVDGFSVAGWAPIAGLAICIGLTILGVWTELA